MSSILALECRELWKNALSLWFRGSGQESQSNCTCGRSQNESQLFLLALPSRWQTLACRSQNFKMCFQGGTAFMFVSSLNLDHFSQCPSYIGPRSLFCFGRVLGVLLTESKPSLQLLTSLPAVTTLPSQNTLKTKVCGWAFMALRECFRVPFWKFSI